MEKEKRKRKSKKLTAKCIGFILIFFAVGLFIGNVYNYQDTIANLFSGQVGRVHIIHSSNEMADRGAKIVLYNLGNEKTNIYDINFNDVPQKNAGRIYNIEGSFTNTFDKHFTTVELNFSLLDKDGNKIGDAFTSCSGLNTGQTWNFSATNNKVIETNTQAVSVILDDVIITTL